MRLESLIASVVALTRLFHIAAGQNVSESLSTKRSFPDVHVGLLVRDPTATGQPTRRDVAGTVVRTRALISVDEDGNVVIPDKMTSLYGPLANVTGGGGGKHGGGGGPHKHVSRGASPNDISERSSYTEEIEDDISSLLDPLSAEENGAGKHHNGGYNRRANSERSSYTDEIEDEISSLLDPASNGAGKLHNGGFKRRANSERYSSTDEIEDEISSLLDPVGNGAGKLHNGGFKRRALSRRASPIKKAFSSVITWYTGHDLLYPSCLSSNKWAPTDQSLVAAVTETWSQAPACGTFVRLTAKRSNKSVVVRVMDTCAGCAKQSAHFDLTKKAFTHLYSLITGFADGITAETLASPPFKKWTPEMVALYGPEKL